MINKIVSTIKSAMKSSGSISFSGGEISLSLLGGTFYINSRNIVREGYRKNDAVYATTKYISSKVSDAEIQIFKPSSSNGRKRLKKNKSFIEKSILKSTEFEEIDDHEILNLLEKPNKSQNKSEFLSYISTFKVLTGNAFIWKVRSGGRGTRSKVVNLIPLPTNFIQPVYNAQNELIEIRYESLNDAVSIPRQDFIHIREFTGSMISELGISRYEAAGIAINSDNNANISAASMMQHGNQAGVFVKKDNSTQESALSSQFTASQKEQAEQDIQKILQSPSGAGKTKILPFEAAWQQIGFKPSEMNFSEINVENLRKICRVNNLPSVIFNDNERMTYNNMEEAKKDAYRRAVIPEINSIVDALNKDLLGDIYFARNGASNLILDYDISSVPEMQQDMKELVEWLSQAWWFTGNEKRKIMGASIDEDNRLMEEGYFIPSGLQHSDEVLMNEANNDLRNNL